MVSFWARIVLVALLIAVSIEALHPVRARIWSLGWIADGTTDATEALEVATTIIVIIASELWDTDATDAVMSFWATVGRAIGEVRSFREADTVEALEAFWAGLSITTGLSTSTKDTLVSRWAGVFSCDRRIGRTRSVNREA